MNLKAASEAIFLPNTQIPTGCVGGDSLPDDVSFYHTHFQHVHGEYIYGQWWRKDNKTKVLYHFPLSPVHGMAKVKYDRSQYKNMIPYRNYGIDPNSLNWLSCNYNMEFQFSCTGSNHEDDAVTTWGMPELDFVRRIATRTWDQKGKEKIFTHPPFSCDNPTHEQSPTDDVTDSSTLSIITQPDCNYDTTDSDSGRSINSEAYSGDVDNSGRGRYGSSEETTASSSSSRLNALPPIPYNINQHSDPSLRNNDSSSNDYSRSFSDPSHDQHITGEKLYDSNQSNPFYQSDDSRVGQEEHDDSSGIIPDNDDVSVYPNPNDNEEEDGVDELSISDLGISDRSTGHRPGVNDSDSFHP